MNVVELYNTMFELLPGSKVELYGTVEPESYNENIGCILEIRTISNKRCVCYNNAYITNAPSVCKNCRTNFYPIYIADPWRKHSTLSACYYKMRKVNGPDVKTIMERR